jgi:sedoheptulose-bisphosphatase
VLGSAMSDKDAATPRLFLIRHGKNGSSAQAWATPSVQCPLTPIQSRGACQSLITPSLFTGETEWSRNGRYTGISDLPLLPEGEAKVRQTARTVFGAGKLIDPTKLTRIICSPRQRATRTLEILLEQVPNVDGGAPNPPHEKTDTTEQIAEWGYGDYDGLRTHEIVALRKSRGHDTERPWNIWRDGCEGPGSESAEQVRNRLDGLIEQITAIHKEGLQTGNRKCDVLVVAHGHILRAFVKRWLKFDMAAHLELMLEPGGVCGLSYAHGNVDERAVLVGMSFPGGD